MNALTKAFVVVVTILAVILVALVVPFAARVPDYAEKYEAMRQDRDAQLTKSSQEKAAFDARLEARDQAVGEANKVNERLASALAQSEARNTGLEAKIASFETTMARTSAAMQVLTQAATSKDGQITEQADVIQKMTALLGELNGQIADLSQSIITVRAENRRLGDNYLRIQEENKALVQQLAEAITNYDDLVKLAEGQGIDLNQTLIATDPRVRIQGSVVKIDQVADGLTFVQLNVGTRDQVKEGMEFTVYRGDSFVGKIQIATVDTAESVGRLTLGGGIQEGDAVRAGGR